MIRTLFGRPTFGDKTSYLINKLKLSKLDIFEQHMKFETQNLEQNNENIDSEVELEDGCFFISLVGDLQDNTSDISTDFTAVDDDMLDSNW